MTKFLAAAGAAIAALFLAQSANAQDADRGHVSVGVTAGTLGIGPEIGYRVNNNVGIRAGANFLSISGSVDSDDIEFDGKVKLKSGGAMLDVYPFGGGFRISAGGRFNGNKARLDGTPTGPTEIGDRTYTAAQIGTLTGEAEVKKFAPAASIGFAGGLRKGLVFTTELGALFQGAVRLKEFTASGTARNDATFKAELEKQRRETQDDIDDYKVYPILQFGLKYRF